jgi:outer membrane protein
VSTLRRLRFRSLAAGAAFFMAAAMPIARSADLAELYGLAETNDPTFQSARFALEAAKQARPEAFSALLPALNASGNGVRTAGTTSYTGTPAINRSFNGDQWALQLTQPLFRADAMLVFDEARSSVQQALAQFAAAEQDLLLRLTRAYFDVVVAEHHRIAAQAQFSALTEQLHAARRSFESGVASVTDVDDAQSRTALAEAQQDSALNDLESSRAALEAITGEEAGQLRVLGADAKLPMPVPSDVAIWVQRATEDNPGVKAAQAALKAADYDVERSQALRLPSVDLVATYGRNSSGGNITEPVDFGTNVRDRSVGVQFSLPLLDGGALHARVIEARAKRGKANADLATAARHAALDAKQAYAAVLSGASQVKALQTALAAGKNAVKGNRIGYGLGIRINSDVLNAEQQYYSSMQDLEKARYDTLFEGLKLKAAAGQLSPADLIALNASLQEAVVTTEKP